MSGPDYIVDIDGLRPGDGAASAEGGKGAGTLRGRSWLAIRWQCCSTYSRIYRNKDGTAYEGRCPKCLRSVRVPIGPGGTSNRFFEAT